MCPAQIAYAASTYGTSPATSGRTSKRTRSGGRRTQKRSSPASPASWDPTSDLKKQLAQAQDRRDEIMMALDPRTRGSLTYSEKAPLYAEWKQLDAIIIDLKTSLEQASTHVKRVVYREKPEC